MTTTPTLPPPPPMPPRLAWVPSLDGLRGLAVVAVVAFHAGHLRGGYLGVDLFFTVSGFLITRLILDDLGRDRFSFSEFWGRRARRLLPALWLLLAVLIFVAPWLMSPTFGLGLRRSIVATAIYIANWWQLAGPNSYWRAFGAAAPLNHTWSLAIEEQFYVLWPIVAVAVWRVARRPARALLTVAVLATAGSIAAQILLYKPGTDGARVYLGTDTRAASILIGCAAAIVLWSHGHHVAPRVWHALHLLAPLALLGIGVSWFLGSEGSWLYHGGLPLLAVGAALVLASSAAPTSSRLNRFLSLAPLVLIGKVSYGIYLWHWPVFSLLGPQQLHVHGWLLLVERLAITGLLVAVSYALVERPYRFRLGPLPIRFFGASACVTGVIVAVLAWPPLPQVSAAHIEETLATWGVQTSAPATTTSPTMTIARSAPASTSTPDPATEPVTEPTTVATTIALSTSAATTTPPATTPAAASALFPAPRRLLVVGDSVAYLLRSGFRDVAPPWLKVIDDGRVACSPGGADHPQVRFDDGTQVLDSCRNGLAQWPARARGTHAEGVLMVFGSSGLAREFDDGWHRPCEAEHDAWFQASLEARMRAVQATGARIWITLAPYNRHASITPDLRAQTDQQTDCLNRIYQTAAADVGGIAVLDLHSLICPTTDCLTSVDGIELRPDGLHFQGPSADLIAQWLVQQLGPAPSG